MYVKKVTKGLLVDCLSSWHAKLAEAVDAAVDGVLRKGRANHPAPAPRSNLRVRPRF